MKLSNSLFLLFLFLAQLSFAQRTVTGFVSNGENKAGSTSIGGDITTAKHWYQN